MTDHQRGISRRQFVAAAGAGAGLAALGTAPGLAAMQVPSSTGMSAPGPMTVLFQGDSITDVYRDRKATGANSSPGLGNGYPLLITSALLAAHPDRQLSFFNRGVSGNTVPDLDARWDADALSLKPDLLSILIGVNDYWHTRNGDYHGTTADYEQQYTALLDRTRKALPSVRIVVLEPFVLTFGAVSADWFPEFDARRAVARKVAAGAGALFLPLQEMFDDIVRRAPNEYWLLDGVHPSAAGHGAIADYWMRKVKP